MNIKYIIRYAMLPSNIIHNECGPNIDRLGGEEQVTKMIQARNNRDRFYEKLEKSILNEGFRNPILVSAGWCPEKKIHLLPEFMKNDHKKILICDRHGGSRLWVAQKYNLEIPCIINDYCSMFPDEKSLSSGHEILKYFKDKPERVIININGVHIRKLPQTHMIEVINE